MPDRPTTTAVRRLGPRPIAWLSAAALAAAPLVVVAQRADAATPLLKAASIANYPGVLEAASSHTLYELSTEKGGVLHCTGGCLTSWHPVLVKSSVKSVSLGAGVKGKIGFVKRTAAEKQVTDNTYPLYTFAGDAGPGESGGEALVADGGTWRMVHASAKTAATTPYLPLLNEGNSSPTYKGVLQSTASRSLYVLSTEGTGTVHCTGGCLSIWPPLLVTSTTTSFALGAGVKGTIGFVTRGSMKQVTFNSYPVYTYTGDTGAAQCNGEGVKADGGTWTLANAGATSASATPVAVGSGCPASAGWGRRP